MLLLLPAILLLCSSCRKAEIPKRAESSNVVAVVAGEPITVEMLQAELARQFRYGAANLTSAQKSAALDALIEAESLFAKAKATGFDHTPEMRARIKNLIVSQFKETQFRPTDPLVTEQDILQYYEANKNRYATPLAVRGAVILLEAPAHPTPEKQKEFRSRAESVLAEAKAAANAQAFADVVRRHSDEQASRYRGGDTGWLHDGGTGADPKLVEALMALKQIGEFASLISTPRGLVIAKLLEKKDAGHKPLSEVKESIRYQLARQKTRQAEADFQASIKSGLDIQLNRELLESVALPAKKTEPPKMPGLRTAQLTP